MRVKVDVFSGFLGAGKTTLIKKLINEGLYKEKVVVIENEFGEIGIDGSVLRRTNIEVKEINAGCICCSIFGDFKKAVKEVIEKYKPERIIIEPSGVAKLSEILTACNSPELKNQLELNMVITVADVMKFDIYSANFGEFYKNQILNARTIMLSRTQKIGLEKLVTVKESIEKLNDKAFIVTTPWDNISGKRIIEISQANAKNSVQNEVSLLKRPTTSLGLRSEKGHSGKEAFETWSIETPKKFNDKNFKNMFDKLNNEKTCGTILRAKGIVQCDNDEWIQFDYVPEEFEMRKTTSDYSGRVCVIGVNLNKTQLKRLFSN